MLYDGALEAAETASALPQDLEAGIQSAVLEYQALVRDPADEGKDLRRAEANCWRALGEGSDGRFLVPYAGIDTALVAVSIYDDAESLQAVVDEPGTAAEITDAPWAGGVLADHRAQDFGGLLLVRPGTDAYLSRPDGTVLLLRCSGIENGTNDGVLRHRDNAELRDEAPYVAYTCRRDARNIRLAYWEIVKTFAESGSN